MSDCPNVYKYVGLYYNSKSESMARSYEPGTVMGTRNKNQGSLPFRTSSRSHDLAFFSAFHGKPVCVADNFCSVTLYAPMTYSTHLREC